MKTTTQPLMTANEFYTWLKFYTHGAARTWSEIVSARCGVNLDRNDLDDAEDFTPEQLEARNHYSDLLDTLRTQGFVVVERDPSGERRWDMWRPLK